MALICGSKKWQSCKIFNPKSGNPVKTVINEAWSDVMKYDLIIFNRFKQNIMNVIF